MTSTVWHWIFGQRHAKMQFMQHALTYAPLNLWAMKKLQWSAYYCHCCLSLLLQSHLTRWVCAYYKLQCCLQFCFPLILYVSVCCDCKYFLKKADLICFSIYLRHVWVHRREKLRFDSLRLDCRYPPNFNWTCSSSIPFQRHLRVSWCLWFSDTQDRISQWDWKAGTPSVKRWHHLSIDLHFLQSKHICVSEIRRDYAVIHSQSFGTFLNHRSIILQLLCDVPHHAPPEASQRRNETVANLSDAREVSPVWILGSWAPIYWYYWLYCKITIDNIS